MMNTSKPWSKKRSRAKSDQAVHHRPSKRTHLSKVLQETTPAAAMELLRANERFALGDGLGWLVLEYDFTTIESGRNDDGALGQFTQLVKGDLIHTVLTDTMFAQRRLAIIPDHDSLDRMRDLSIIRNAQCRWALAQYSEGALTVTSGAPASYGEAVKVSVGKVDVAEVAYEAADDDAAALESESAERDGDVDAAQQTNADQDADDEQWIDDGEEASWEEADDDVPAFDRDPVSADHDDDLGEPFDDLPDEAAAETDGQYQHGSEHDETDEATYDEVLFETDGEVDEDTDEAEVQIETDTSEPEVLHASAEQVRAQLARTFVSDELTLQVKLDEFDAMFNVDSPALGFTAPVGVSDWLSEHIQAELVTANAALAATRQAHRDELQQSFVNQASRAIEQVMRDVALDRKGSRYFEVYEQILREHEQRLGEKDAATAKAHAEITEKHQRLLEQAASQAASEARLRYEDRHRVVIEREKKEAVALVERTIEDTHLSNREAILKVRRFDAQRRAQAEMTRIFEGLSERHQQQLRTEAEQMAEFQSRLNDLVSNLRASDVTHVNVMAEQQRITDVIASARQEHEAAMAALRDEAERERIQAAQALTELETSTAAEIAERDAHWKQTLDLTTKISEANRERSATLLAQLGELESRHAEEMEARIGSVQREKDEYIAAAERAAAVQSRYSVQMIVVLVMLVVLAVVAGFIGGVGYAG